MDYSTILSGSELALQSSPSDPKSLYATFEQVPDGREKQGKQYPLALLLTLLVLAKLAGETTVSGAAHWVRLRKEWLCQAFNLSRDRLPCQGTYYYALRKVQAEQVQAAIQHSLTALPAGKQPQEQGMQQVAIDGKTLRGTLGHAGPNQEQVHLLAAYEVNSGTVLAQCLVQHKKHNEITMAPQLLKQLSVQECVFSSDALHTQRKWCRHLDKRNGKYILIAKGNQAELRSEIALLFQDPHADRMHWGNATSCQKGHGRLEKREITTSSELKDYLAADWQGVEQVFRLERTITRQGITKQEVVYGLTNLSADLAGPNELLHFVRRHWSVENRLHWRRDVTLGEDHCQVRTDQAPQVLAVLNSTVLAIMDRLQVTNVPAQMREFAAFPQQALALLLAPF